MARWSLVLCLVLLSGCASPENRGGEGAGDASGDLDGVDGTTAAAGADRPASSDGPVAAGPRQDTKEFTGQMTGVGYVTPATGGFIGAISQPQGFTVAADATHLQAVLTWDVPADVYLEVYPPGGERVEAHELTGAIDRTLTLELDDVPPGSWTVMALANGPAVVSYAVTVTVDYAS